MLGLLDTLANGFQNSIDGITSHVPFGVGAKYNAARKTIAQGPVQPAIAPKRPEPGPVINPNFLHELSMNPLENIAWRKQQQAAAATPSPMFQQVGQRIAAGAIRRPGLQVLPSTMQTYGRTMEDEHSPLDALTRRSYNNQQPTQNSSFLQNRVFMPPQLTLYGNATQGTQSTYFPPLPERLRVQ